MLEGREHGEWWHTAALSYAIYYTQPRKGARMKPKDFHPMIAKGEKTTISLKELGSILTGANTA